jgi:hypothetical protein
MVPSTARAQSVKGPPGALRVYATRNPVGLLAPAGADLVDQPIAEQPGRRQALAALVTELSQQPNCVTLT